MRILPPVSRPGRHALAKPRQRDVNPGRLAYQTCAASNIASGSLLLVLTVLAPGSLGGIDLTAMRWVNAVSIATGLVVLHLPWDRWPRHATQALVPLGLAMLFVADQLVGFSASPQAASTFPSLFIVVLGWTGLTQGRFWALAWSPVVAAVYLAMLATSPAAVVANETVLIAVPVGVLLGELGGWVTTGLQRAQADAALRADSLHALASALARAKFSDSVEASARTLVALSRDVLHARTATLQLSGGPDRPARLTVQSPLLASASSLSRSAAADEDLLDRLLLEAATATAGTRVMDAGTTPPSRVIVAPVGGQGGALAVHVAAEVVSSHDVAMVELLALQSGQVLARAHLMEALTEQANSDQLTGLGNRRYVGTLLDTLDDGDVLVLLDLDHFKEVNDTDGHQAGDEVLRQFARALRSFVRDVDAVGRYGGEEFLVLCRRPPGPVLSVADRILHGWRALSPRVTVSAGVAVHHGSRSPLETLARADEALYAAKRAGRDRAVAES